MNGVYNIGIDRRFADELARGLLAEHSGDPLLLADALILVPTRRSIRALRESFLRAADGRPTILPRLVPLGDIDEGEWADLSADGASLGPPPAIDPVEREALLTGLVAAFKDDQGEPVAQSAAEALKLARELGALLDELAIDAVPFEKLEKLVERGFAHHWRRTLRFLAIVGEAWPKVLAERGQIDALDRRTRSIRAQAERWRLRPPASPVIAAGSTGSQPATRELLSVIAALPQGVVVLPGLDRDMDEASWQELEPTHPQFGLRELLAALGRERSQVAEWPGGPGDRARRMLIAELMRPAETSDTWKRPSAAALDHVTRVDCATPNQEAVVAALALREVLQDRTRTAALVTPDRELARRVAAELRRWNIDIDDSAGRPLVDTPPAVLLRALLDAVERQFAPVALLALLKHPLCTLGLDRAVLLDAVRRLDRKCLRGLKPAPGLTALRRHVDQTDFAVPAERQTVIAVVQKLDVATAKLAALMDKSSTPVTLIDATVEAAEKLTAPETLWSGEAGEALADALARLRSAWHGRHEVAGAEWPSLLVTMLSGEILRPVFGRHPRLAIWGPLEARLQRADFLVLGGLNEGAWPPAVDTGPWINRPMRTALGLPQPERRIGLSAHDFAAALAAERVLLTRAEREGGSPTVPSRWLARLDALFGYDATSAVPAPEYIQRGRRSYLAWAEAIDSNVGYKPWPRPEPRPPVEARPTRLSVSRVEQWRRDPYGLYARSILGLEPLKPLEEELGAADRGSALHKALDEFLKACPSGPLPADAVGKFEALGEKYLGDLLAAPAERAFWWPRFQRMARWFVATENGRRAAGARLLASETNGVLKLAGLTIEARADRIDAAAADTWEIVDYKTGRVPSAKELEKLFAPQLLLEAAMAEGGGFANIASKPKSVRLAYWQANGLGEGGTIKEVNESEKLVAEMRALVARMASHFAKATTPYRALPWPEFIPHFNDYKHLERVAEWSTAGSGGE